jgi:hypothetical protein
MQRLDQPRHRVHRDAGAEDGHHRKRAGVQRARLLVEAHAQKLGHRARLRAVVERHHEDAHKDHGRDGADAVEVRRLQAVLGARSAHADDFLRAQVGADEGQAADPRGQRAPGLEEVLARLHVALEGKADAQHKDEVQQHDQPIDGGEVCLLKVTHSHKSRKKILGEAHAMYEEDIAACKTMGAFGGALLPDEGGVLTHCNAGALATCGYGTALGVIRSAVEQGKQIHVYADETRPFLQGARLTAWELMADGIPTTVICDNMAASLMRAGRIQAVVVGADRIAANGDVANKIGTYNVAILAKEHGIPFYVAAPWSTIDLATRDRRSHSD